MKVTTLILGILIAFIFMSCEDVRYKQTQPANNPSINTIPKEFIGTYVNDHSYLLVNNKSFTLAYIEETSNNKITGILGENAILKQFKSIYYLNLKVDDNDYWNVASFELNQKILTIKAIIESESISKFKTYVTSETIKDDETTIIKIDPTQSQFEKMVADGLFTPYDKYTKISNSILSHEKMTKMVKKRIEENKNKK